MIIGIDLGTTYSLCSYYDGKAPQLIPNAHGGVLTPSEVHIGEDVYVGDCVDSEKYPYHFRFFKEFMGTNRIFQAGEQEFTPVQLSALVLKQLKADAEAHLNQHVTEAIISVPAYFNDNQRIATKQAGQLAGLNTTRLVNEPSAAALAYQFGFDEASLMIFDFGGGTFDVSMVDCFDNIIEILAVSGDNHLGGKNVDKLLADYFCQQTNTQNLSAEEMTRLCQDMEVLKESLSAQGQMLYSFQGKELLFTKPLLRDLCQPIFNQLKVIMAQAVRDSEKDLQDIDQVILVGGSSNLEGLPQFIQNLMGKKPLLLQNPQTVVALGMGYYVGMKSRHHSLCELILTDVCPFSLGIATVHNNKDSNPHLTPLIPRNTTLPATKKSEFVTVHPDQKSISLEIYQGEGYFAEENILLSTLNIDLPRQTNQKIHAIQVTFTYDFNGILQVDVQGDGIELTHKVLSDQTKHYSPEELQAAAMSLNFFKLAQETPQNDPLVREANYFYGIVGRKEKELLRAVLDEYRKAQLKSRVEERKAQRKLRFLLDKMEEWEEERNPFSQQYHFRDYLADQGEEEFSLDDFEDFDDDQED